MVRAKVQEITENMGFCGQMGALIANVAAFAPWQRSASCFYFPTSVYLGPVIPQDDDRIGKTDWHSAKRSTTSSGEDKLLWL